MSNPVIVWFRNDLRVEDHAPLLAAARSGRPVIPLYVLDERLSRAGMFGLPRIGSHRAAFLSESLRDLDEQLRALGSALVVRQGAARDVVLALSEQSGAEAVLVHHIAGTEETGDISAVGRALKARGAALKLFWGATLLHPEDLPFDGKQVPEVFTQFRTKVEKPRMTVRAPLPAPQKLPPVDAALVAPLPTVASFGLPAPAPSITSGDSRGGSAAGAQRVREWIWERDRLRRYKDTRNGMLQRDDASKLSAWLAHGCLSPRVVYAEVQRYERERVKNDSTYWLIFELLWRDYFHFIALKHGARLFRASGLQGLSLPWRDDRELFARWRDGATGFPIVDANMRELAQTGFMSNRGRQNVGSFLTKNLGLDWRLGAAYFEQMLVDYDVASNWGNWLYVAGVGNDARGFRFFNLHKQAQDYDPNGDYVRHWLPMLARVPGAKAHRPELLTSDEQARYGVRIGQDYPAPIVDLFASAKRNEALYDAALSGQGVLGI
jgi:deoxyribodipyrimidine photo-lyase